MVIAKTIALLMLPKIVLLFLSLKFTIFEQKKQQLSASSLYYEFLTKSVIVHFNYFWNFRVFSG
jgi:hypothetical protein